MFHDSAALPSRSQGAVCLAACVLIASFATPRSLDAQELSVVSTSPRSNELNIAPVTTIRVTFDRAVLRGAVNRDSFWAYGRSSGPVLGTTTFEDDDHTIALVPRGSFYAGEIMTVILSHDLQAADGSPMRSAGYCFQFWVRTRSSTKQLERVQLFSNAEGGRTRIYGAAAKDMNGDGFLDLVTVNEISADLRTMFNAGDGSGQFSEFPAQRLPIGTQASPNDTGDFNRDGRLDIAVAASQDHNIWICLNQGNGLYRDPAQDISVGQEPKGVVCLDVDGDGDLDVVNANSRSNNLSVLLNDGRGVFGEPTFFEGGVEFEYGLGAGDMNGDGILDLVVGGRIGERIRTMVGNGDGTFDWLPLPVQGAGGQPWVLVLGDLDGDGDLDVTAANGHKLNGAVLLNQGDGAFDAPVVYETGGLTISTDLGDLDGDGDLDWVLSNFGTEENKTWPVLENDGTGTFTVYRSLPCPSEDGCGNPSCAVLFDFDNDRDLDIVATDEILDKILSFRNGGLDAFGDENADGEIDAHDAARFAECYSGEGTDAGLACQFADFDGDGDVDCDDREQFRAAWTGGEPLPPFAPCEQDEMVFRRGEVNLDGLFDLADGIAIFVMLFQGGAAPGCPDSADSNDDAAIDISDGIYILLFLFGGGGAPPAPGPFDCGLDGTPDGLSECVYPMASCEA